MKALIAISLLLALGVASVAKPSPIEGPRPAFVRDDTDINIGATGATQERNYFQAAQPQFNAGAFLCRLPLVIFDKTHLASSCH